MPQNLFSNLLGLVGAILGGVVGFYTFRWLLDHGFYGLIIPGAFLGLGCSLLARHPSTARGVCCGIAALALSVFTDWYFTITNESFTQFAQDGKNFSSVTLLMIGIGTLVAFWVGKDAAARGLGARQPTSQPASESEPPQKV
jgi:hypothetical protein